MPKLLQPQFKQNQNTWEIDVPGDNSCLFWAVALAYLIPVKDDDYVFKERFKKLFGKESSEQLEHVKNWIRTTYNPFSNDEATHHYEILTRLVREQFRNRIVNHMRKPKNRGRFEHHIPSDEGSLDAHLERMKDPNTCGGRLEIRAMSQLLDCRIKVIKDGVDLFYGNGTDVRLFHVEGTPASREANHYHFGLKKSLGDAYQVAIKSEVGPRHNEATTSSMKREEDTEKGNSEQSGIEESKKKIRIDPPLGNIPNLGSDELEPIRSGKRFKPALSEGDYNASGLRLSLHGAVYQLKLLMLFLKR